MPRLKIYFCYDGTRFNGFQRQKNTPFTIQEALETKLSMIANQKVSLLASGRTDAGVHARVQLAHADVPETMLKLLAPSTSPGATGTDSRLKQALNSLLPPDIRILLLEQADDDFHAIRDAIKKTYLYFINPNPVQWPELRDHAWHLRLPLDWRAMEEATVALLGKHDFKAFCAANTTAKTTVRTIHEARWGTMRWKGMTTSCDLKVLRLTGSGFLKNMVRVITGTLVHIGQGKADPGLILRALESRDRRRAGPTAPPHGLWLWDVQYAQPAKRPKA